MNNLSLGEYVQYKDKSGAIVPHSLFFTQYTSVASLITLRFALLLLSFQPDSSLDSHPILCITSTSRSR
jgi:hypothetical protein